MIGSGYAPHSSVTIVDPSGAPRALRLDVTVGADGGGGGGVLPVTGPVVVWLIVVGFAVSLAGLVLVCNVRRQ